MKRTIEVDDTLQDYVDGAIEAVKTYLQEYLEENYEQGEEDISIDLGNDLDYSGAIHEIIDSSVPIYTHVIDTAYYLHGNQIDEAFNNAGLGSRDDDWPRSWRAAAIYCYIEQEVNEWFYNNVEEVIEEFTHLPSDSEAV